MKPQKPPRPARKARPADVRRPTNEPVQQVWLTNLAGELLFDESGAAVFVEVAD